MPRLHGVLIVLENNFEELMERSWQHRCSKGWRSSSWNSLNGIQTENTRDVEVICKLQRGVRINIRDAVDGISLLPTDKWCRIGKDNSPRRCNFPVMEWTLRIWPSCIWCQIPPSKAKEQVRLLKSYNSHSCLLFLPTFQIICLTQKCYAGATEMRSTIKGTALGDLCYLPLKQIVCALNCSCATPVVSKIS